MISVTQAQDSIERFVHPLAAETIHLEDFHGRILRETIVSPDDIPAFDRSAMDGYAVRDDDPSEDFTVVDQIRAGQVINRHLNSGETIRIFTGARMPGPNLKVVLQEHVETRDKRIRLLKRTPASNVRLRAEDAKAGETLMLPGISLDATAVALLASLGKTTVHVTRKPRILHLTTGDEIVSPGQTPAAGQIRNSNASLIAGLCREQGIDTLRHVHAPDDLSSLQSILSAENMDAFDVILISGGSGSGDYDFSAKLFQHLGATIHFQEVNVRPGKPLFFGMKNSQVIFGLPGNSLSHFVCFHLFVRRALDRMLARPSSTGTHAFLIQEMTETSNARETWWPGVASFSQGHVSSTGSLECHALPWKSSGDITRLPAANALIKVPASTPQLFKGTLVEILLTRNLS